MVSTLWKACSDGDQQKVDELLKDASSLDIELKDHTGVTALIEAVRNGHVAVVKSLLDKGADPSNASSLGRPDQYTSDPAILELLNQAQSKATSNSVPSHEPIYVNDSHNDSDKRFYGPLPGAYTYYPTINPALSTVTEGGVYYPPPPPQAMSEQNNSNGIGHLPPPEIARFIPCRYYPACRYGTSCLFAHPQTPYYQGPVPPPTQYPSYDHMGAPAYMPNYYPVSQPPFPQPNGVHPMAPLSPPPGPHVMHGRSPSEVISPSQQTHFSPNVVQPPLPFNSIPPSAYQHPSQVPVPMPITNIPPLPHQSTLPPHGPQSPSMYNSNPPPAPSFPIQQDATNQYPQQPPTANVNYPDVDNGVKPLPTHTTADAYGPNHIHRDGNRRGAPRRGSFGGRKPPCLFYPSGRCKNGDDCRFPHVIPENPQAGSHQPPYYSGRGGGPRSRGHVNGNGNGHTFATIEEKMGNMNIRDDSSRHQNGADGSSRSQSTDPGSRPRFSHGAKNYHAPNGGQPGKRSVPVKQRVPNADEFPVLAGSTTPPSRSPGLNGVLQNGSANSHNGPTAAQVLQAPPPTRKDPASDSGPRESTTPEPVKSPTVKENIVENGASPEPALPTSEQSVSKLPISFAAVATATPDIHKEVSVSA